jgi:hypothetical protein
MTQIYPNKHHPYYILAPRYMRTSAGIKVLYLLCHHLNLKGYQAYIVTNPRRSYEKEVYDLKAPFLTNEIINYHYKNRRTPITVYPETICGNPLNSPIVARYVLNYLGLLDGDKELDDQELVFTYSQALADSVAKYNPNILYLPAANPQIFYPPKKEVKREGKCFYASKHVHILGGKLLPITNDCFEITRDLPDSLTPQEIADLFRKSELFYTYEDTSLSTEAVMCGCPAIFIPSEFQTQEPLALKETGSAGIVFGTSDENIKKAKDTVHLAFEQFIQSTENFSQQLDNFINITQEKAKNTKYEQKITLPKKYRKNSLFWLRKILSQIESYIWRK